MRRAPVITLSPEQRRVLESQARSRSFPLRVVERARIVLLAAAGRQDKEIAALLSMTPKKVSRWRKRFLALGVAGLLKDAPRPGRKPTISARLTQRVVTMTTRQQPSNATHWSTRTMAAVVGISEASVRRIWRAHGLKPHRVETFKISNDPAFAEKLEDIVGLYLNSPKHALVLCVDEKSQIQALDRTQPGLPLKRGRGATMTHDYKRFGGTLWQNPKSQNCVVASTQSTKRLSISSMNIVLIGNKLYASFWRVGYARIRHFNWIIALKRTSDLSPNS
jgi:transposase